MLPWKLTNVNVRKTGGKNYESFPLIVTSSL
uniref:Uncharacterized protein n=1 Tax=Anguilla anguilla TaxID=7936 RepID=A0A0E9S708_ANGAN